MSIAGKYQNTSNDNVAGVFKALGATDQMIAAGSDKEEKTLIITDNGGDSFTIDIGPAKSTFKIGDTFDNTIMGGKLTVK